MCSAVAVGACEDVALSRKVKMQNAKVKTEIGPASPASTSSGPMKQHLRHPVTELCDHSRRARLPQLA